jgi:hypothetical protein
MPAAPTRPAGRIGGEDKGPAEQDQQCKVVGDAQRYYYSKLALLRHPITVN